MAIEIVGKSEDVQRYRKYLHDQGLYTKRFMNTLAKNSGLPLQEKPDGFRIFHGGIKNVYSIKGNEKVKGFDESQKLYIKGIANANIVDRADERLDPTGIDIENYMKNRVLLLDHMYTASATVGRVISLDSQDSGVHFEAYVGDPQKAVLTQAQRDARSLIAQGLLQTVSVGFIPHKVKAPEFDDEGRLMEPAVILAWELLELSIVAVPANAGSVFEAGNLSASNMFTSNKTKARINTNDNFITGVRAEDAISKVEDERAMEEKLIELLEELKKMGSLLTAMNEKMDALMVEEEEEYEEEGYEEEDEKEMDEEDEEYEEDEKMEDEVEDEEEEEDGEMKSLKELIDAQNEKIDTIASVMLKLMEAKDNG